MWYKALTRKNRSFDGDQKVIWYPADDGYSGEWMAPLYRVVPEQECGYVLIHADFLPVYLGPKLYEAEVALDAVTATHPDKPQFLYCSSARLTRRLMWTDKMAYRYRHDCAEHVQHLWEYDPAFQDVAGLLLDCLRTVWDRAHGEATNEDLWHSRTPVLKAISERLETGTSAGLMAAMAVVGATAESDAGYSDCMLDAIYAADNDGIPLFVNGSELKWQSEHLRLLLFLSDHILLSGVN